MFTPTFTRALRSSIVHRCCMAIDRRVITAAEMAAMTPQQRADVIEAGHVRSWHDVDERFTTEVLAAAIELGAQRRAQH
jgi:hypothetical protein